MAFARKWGGGGSHSFCFWCSDPSDNHYDHKEDKDRTSDHDGDNKILIGASRVLVLGVQTLLSWELTQVVSTVGSASRPP